MKDKIVLLLIVSLLALLNSYAQDVITKTNGDDIKAKVFEVNQTDVKYKRYESPSGPVHVISKSDVLMIRYEDGTKDIFKSEETVPVPENKNNIIEKKRVKTVANTIVDPYKRGTNVYISSDDRNAIIHCKKALKMWNYWNVVDNIEDADITANVIVQQKGAAFESVIEIVNSKSKETILKTDMALAYASDHPNPKKASIERAVNVKLKPLIKEKGKDQITLPENTH